MAEPPEQRFGALTQHFLRQPDVSEGTGFGKMPGLRAGGKIFAMLVSDRLVVKLPRARVDALVEGGGCERFETSPGRVMKEWVTVPADAGPDWEALAAEAQLFVRGRR